MAPCAVAWWLAGLGLIRIRSTSTHRCARRNIIFRYLFDGIPCLNFDDRFGGLALDFFLLSLLRRAETHGPQSWGTH